MSGKQIVIKVGMEAPGDLPSLQQIIFNDPHEALRVAQELLTGAQNALNRDIHTEAGIRIMISGKADIAD